MSRRFKTVADVVRWRLCLGCGACAYICPVDNVRLLDFPDEGVRPIVENGAKCESCGVCLEVCPSFETDHTNINQRPGLIANLKSVCGPVLEIWEGHARDPEIRLAGSSGGALTALALYCLERRQMHGVLHIGSDPKDPVFNVTRMSRTRAELLAKTGSRYAPASACDRLDSIETAPAPCVFIGQPSEVTALRKAQRLRPELDRKVGLALSFFCAGSPSTQGTLDLLKKMGIKPDEIESLRYRGNGWPGHFAATRPGGREPAVNISYRESWSFLQAYRPYSTHLCPDGTGEDADISCGDPWYRPVRPGEPGSSLVVARTGLGREILRGAMAAGYLDLTPASPQKLLDSQRNLINKRRAIWGRLVAFKLFGLPTTKLRGFSLFKLWCELPLKEKLKSTLGTARRILMRKYYRPLELVRANGKQVRAEERVKDKRRVASTE